MERISPKPADNSYATIVKRLLDGASTIPASQGIEQWTQPFKIENIERNIEKGGICVFYDEHENPVGTIDLRYEDTIVWGDDETPAIYAHRLAIDPAYSGKGIGGQIINWVINKAREEDIDFVRLDCVAHNAKLRAYYESKGFVHIRNVEYGGNEASLYQLTV